MNFRRLLGRTTRSRYLPSFAITGILSALICVCGINAPAFGQFFTVISDGFGDGDLDGNGTPLEAADARQGSYIPNKFGTFDGPVDMEGNPTETGPRIPSLQQEVTAGTLTLDPTDSGLKWFSTRGFTSSNTGDPKAFLNIFHDTTAAPPVDAEDPFSRFPGTDPLITTYASGAAVPTLTALNSGLALGYEGKGGGSSAAGFFGQTVSLGDTVGDQLRVGVDFRAWISAPNDNGDANPPNAGEFRFGIYEDTDNQLGLTNPSAGVSGTPAVWGEAHGLFMDGSPGANGDAGFYTAIQVGDVANPGIFFQPDGSLARIREESNTESATERFLEGGSDFYAGGREEDVFLGLDNTKSYRLELTLERVLADDEITDAIAATYTVTDLADPSNTWSMSGQDRLRDRDGDGEPDDTLNYFADEFDYFALRNTGTSASNDWDLIIDNFAIEIAGSNVPSGLNCDAAGASACDIVDLDALYAAFGSGGQFDYSGNGTVGPEDIAGWLAEASTAANTANTGGDTYILGDADLNGDVDSTDLGLLLNNFGAAGGTWGQGNLDGIGGVDSTDLGLLLNNFGSTSAATSAVPEPSTGVIALIGALFVSVRRRRRR